MGILCRLLTALAAFMTILPLSKSFSQSLCVFHHYYYYRYNVFFVKIHDFFVLRCFPHIYFMWVVRPSIFYDPFSYYLFKNYFNPPERMSLIKSINRWTIFSCFSSPIYRQLHPLCRGWDALWHYIPPINALILMRLLLNEGLPMLLFYSLLLVGCIINKLPPHAILLLLWQCNCGWKHLKREVCFFDLIAGEESRQRCW